MQFQATSCECFLVDAHVHYHECFEPEAFLQGALGNFEAGARELGLDPQTPGLLLLTELGEADYFEEFTNARDASRREWTFCRTQEDNSLIACRRGDPKLVLVAGRQVLTAEGLEVLALAVRDRIRDGYTIAEAVKTVLAAGAVAVIPWGFGKWWFSRGAVVRSQVKTATPGALFLGDNGGRIRLAPRPRLFSLAESTGIFTLPGSDPLPFPSQVGRAGSYGFLLEGRFSWERPTESLKTCLRRLESQPRAYGRRQRLLSFLRYQTAMQLRKRAGR